MKLKKAKNEFELKANIGLDVTCAQDAAAYTSKD
jgi:hypothetical protein